MRHATPLALACLLAVVVTTAPSHAQDRASVVPSMPVLLENECVRVQYHDVAVGETTPMHAHPHYVVYVLAPYRARLIPESGASIDVERRPGDVSWHQATRHAVQNTGDTPIHNLVVEIKPGPGCNQDH